MSDATVHWGSVRCEGHTMCYREAGPADAPAVLLLHGLASDSGTWDLAIPPLAARGLRVLAPDLLGHGRSAVSAVGYSLERFAASLAELIRAIGLSGATLVGHSLGGAVAMYFAYQYPRHTDRLVLVASGGLGKHVHPLLRAATLPGSRTVLRLLVNQRTAALCAAPRLHRALRIPAPALENLRRAGTALVTPEGRTAFIESLRSVVTPSGQRGSMIEARYVGTHVPTLVTWTEHDHVIPVSHAHAVHRYVPGSRLELFPGSSHELHRRYADRFADVLADFVATTEPARLQLESR